MPKSNKRQAAQLDENPAKQRPASRQAKKAAKEAKTLQALKEQREQRIARKKLRRKEEAAAAAIARGKYLMCLLPQPIRCMKLKYRFYS
jgi:hypothetical protein